jgi:hypothetical protein
MPQQIPALPGLAQIARLLRPISSTYRVDPQGKKVPPPPSPLSIFRIETNMSQITP